MMDSEEFTLESCPFIVADSDSEPSVVPAPVPATKKSQKRPEPDLGDGTGSGGDDDFEKIHRNSNPTKRPKITRTATSTNNNENSPARALPLVEDDPDPYDLFGLVSDDEEDERAGGPTGAVPVKRSAPVAPVAPTPTLNVRYRRVLKVLPTSIPYIPISCSDGTRLYLRLLPQLDSESSISLEPEDPNSHVLSEQELNAGRREYRNLLGINFQHLKKEARQIKDKFHGKIDELIGHGHGNDLRILNPNSAGNHNQQLLVDKYKPKGYMDLLSEETVNRSLMHWLKIWDHFVFGSDYLNKFKELRDKYSGLETKENEKIPPWAMAKKSILQLVEDDDYDETGRPKQKIALLHGPAGLGKTTAAHVIARHSGYSVIEMNASDDRSVDIFRKTLLQSTESKSEVFHDGRPTCLIIDEIDGAPAATIDVLVNLISGKTKEIGKNSKANNAKKTKILRRPIICICNDLFVPALKGLRTASTLILQFNPISIASLVERIEEISLKENLEVDTGTLNLLAEKSDCDIRSCLSSLQFIKRHKSVSAHSGNSASALSNRNFLNSIGNQNKSKGIFKVWDEIFGLPQCKKYYFNNEDPTRSDIRFKNILKTAQNFGDYDKLLSGIWENYLGLKFRDSYFQNILNTIEWTIWYDFCNREIYESQNYSLYGFLPIYFVVIHFLLGTRSKVNLKYPNNMVYQRSLQNMNNFKSQIDGIPPSVGRFITLRDALLDIFPSLVGIIQPLTIRAIPSQLWSPRERETIQNIVSIMIAYHLTYFQTRNPVDGTYNYQLEPNIEDLVKFTLEDLVKQKQNFPYSIKQLIGREVELEKLRQDSDQPGEIIRSSTNSQKSVPGVAASTDKKIEIKNSPSSAPIIPKDFFGRPIIKPKILNGSSTGEKGESQKSCKPEKSDIWFRFKEGYSNAVRKTLKLKDFM